MGIFSYTPMKEGPGVPENGPKLRQPFEFFRVFGFNFWNLIKVNVLFLICCIPVITIGPAIAALTYVVKCHGREEHVFLMYDFFRVFKENFFKGVGVWLLNLLCVYSLYVSYANYQTSAQMRNLFFPLVLVNILIIMMDFYMYPMMVGYELSFPALIKNGFIFALIKLPQNFLAFILFAGILICAFGFYPAIGVFLSFFILPAGLWFFAVYYNRNYIENNMKIS